MTTLQTDPTRNAFTAGGWQPRSLARRTRDNAAAALPPPEMLRAPAEPAGMLPPPADPRIADVVRAITPPPPQPTGPSSGGTISLPDGRAFAVAPGTGRRAALPMPGLPAADAFVLRERERAGLPPRPERAPLPANLPDPGLLALERGLPLETADFIARRASPPPTPPPLGTMLNVGGVPFVQTNPNQITPLPRPDQAPELFQMPEVVEQAGRQFYRSGPREEFRPLPAQGSEMNPLVLGAAQTKLANLEQELAGHQAAMMANDNRYGVLNLRSRDARVKQLQAEIAGTRAMMGARPGATSAASASPAPAAASAPMNERDRQALAWARSNPQDPRAAQILARLGGGAQ
jgi:hypothetical protein